MPANMTKTDEVRFISSAVKLPPFSPPPRHHSLFSSARSNFAKLPFNFNFNFNFNVESQPINFISQFLKNQPFVKKNHILNAAFKKKPPLFCSAALALSDSAPMQSKGGDEAGSVTQSKNVSSTRATEEERVLISEVLVRNKDGEELERKDLEAEALNALKASRANSALTVHEVQEDVHRIIASGYFMSCMPVAVDTRDGIRLIFQVEQNQEFQGLVCEGANVLPAKFIEDAFRDAYGAFFSCFYFFTRKWMPLHFSMFLMLDLLPLMCQVMQEKLLM